MTENILVIIIVYSDSDYKNSSYSSKKIISLITNLEDNMLLPIDQLEKAAVRAPKIKNGKNISALSRDLKTETAFTLSDKGVILNPQENLEKRKEMLHTLSVEPTDFAFERAIGNNDAVYSNFADLIENAKRKVGKIIVKNGNKNTAFATGFMVSDKLLLTNWHVFNSKEDVKNSEVVFFYEYNLEGDPMPTVRFNLDADTFFHSSKDLDYCLVAVKPTDITGKHQLNEIGYIFLDPTIGKLGNENEEKLNIIHHPEGDYKQLSIRENLFVKITDISIWYQTDTAQGSSGSPVFNDQWQVVALHHMGIALKNEQGQYIDKNGNPIPVNDNKIDGSKVVWIANEGIRISVLLKDIFSKFPDDRIIAGLKVKFPLKFKNGESSGILNESSTTNDGNKMESIKHNNNIEISFPSSLMNESGSVTITINTNKLPKQQGLPDNAKQPAERLSMDEILLAEENKRLEDSTDYSLCKGYQANFLGSGNKSVSIPQPAEKIKKFIAKTIGSTGIILKYYNYSVIFHSVRMMPIISCVNVAGDPGERTDRQKRKDNWLRDSRLSFDTQLNDSWYRGSGFDRGHMSRREDADWGATADDAFRNANLTCMYTNACPQVPKINRSDSGKNLGLWGKLEQLVLEKGVEKEVGKTSKMSVFNGPIFQDDDPVFKGIQIPMDFYKIVIWLTDTNDLKATAFRLSQTKLVSNIDFEEIDIDQNTEFKPYHVSIKQLAKDTNIDFSAIEPIDTFEGKENEFKEITEETVKKHIDKHNK